MDAPPKQPDTKSDHCLTLSARRNAQTISSTQDMRQADVIPIQVSDPEVRWADLTDF